MALEEEVPFVWDEVSFVIFNEEFVCELLLEDEVA